jgi:alginate O-acetyltransferase complex protein AlgI
MLFNSLSFLFFFLLVIFVYFLVQFLSQKIISLNNILNKNVSLAITFLLLFSLFFYAFSNPIYLLFIIFSIITTWYGAICIDEKRTVHKKSILLITLITNVIILLYFKYFVFFSSTVALCLNYWGIHVETARLDLSLPLGISFYTFQLITYLVDVYNGKIHAERNIITYAVFVTFFPKLLAGPIERAEHFLPQLHENHVPSKNDIYEGMKLSAWGFFLKIVIADRIAPYVNKIYASPGVYSGFSLTVATFLFSFQILCDFAGYSDIAIGTARILGFKLMTNFKQP